MKKLSTIIVAVLVTVSTFAQAPDKMSYQSVVRDAGDALVQSQIVGMQISILQGSTSGTEVYVETQMPTTNINGLVSIEIGSGTIVSGAFNTIDWSNGPYFIKTETDPTGGTNYTITGTSELLSVPYALHAATAESVVGNGGKHYLGEEYGGGIIYELWMDSSGVEHGLIVNKGEGMGQWMDSLSLAFIDIRSTYDGAYNTSLMTNSTAADYVSGLNDGGFTDWYLPSVDELSLLWHNRFYVQPILENGGYTPFSFPNRYWASTECTFANAYTLIYQWGYVFGEPKYNLYNVRAIRSF